MKRVLFELTETWVADLDDEEAEWVLAPDADVCDLSDVFERLKRIAQGRKDAVCDASLTVEDAADAGWVPDWVMAIDGTAPQNFYWTARQRVMEAGTVLTSGRYREGDCKEMDAVRAALSEIEERLRLLALAVDEKRKS